MNDLVTPAVTILGVLIANITMILSLFLWVRAESRTDLRELRADAKHMEARLESNRELVRAIHEEMKDFHNKLCTIKGEKPC